MWREHKVYWLKKSFIFNVALSIVFLIIAFFINHYANSYVANNASNYVTDIILDNIPVIDVHLIFSEGAILFIIALIAIFSYEPKHLPFAVKSIAVFILVRSFFMVLTHLAPPLGEIYINPGDLISQISSGNDLFFSAHTGLPFLMAFIFWEQKKLRYFFFSCSLVGGIAVLLGHLHYSIDVFSATFIAFGIFHICKNIFPKDFELTIQDPKI
ncbi:MAG: phosphatase PAP2-related protein [Candidatus Falkowbacteria bacterium]|nr:phosphatase PAP2-related protein [Candidatus Falkowbacteria bacterium]